MRSAADGAAVREHVTVQHTAVAPADAKTAQPIDHVARCAVELTSLRVRYRQTALDSVAAGRLAASDAMANVDAVRLLDRRAHHAWRAVAYLAGVT